MLCYAMLCFALLCYVLQHDADTRYRQAACLIVCRTWRCQVMQLGSRWRTCACCSTPLCEPWLRTSSPSCSATTTPPPPPTLSSFPPTSSCWLPRGRRSTLSSIGGFALSPPNPCTYNNYPHAITAELNYQVSSECLQIHSPVAL